MEPPSRPRFRIAIHRCEGTYYARALDIPGCVGRGSSEVEAVENARTAICTYIRVAQLLATDRATVQLEISA